MRQFSRIQCLWAAVHLCIVIIRAWENILTQGVHMVSLLHIIQQAQIAFSEAKEANESCC